MRKGLKITLFTLFLCLFTAGTVTLFLISRNRHRSVTCEKTEIHIKGRYSFVDEDEINGYLHAGFEDIWGTLVDSLDLGSIESYIRDRSAVKDCEAWCSRDGCLHLEISQRVPAVRFKAGEQDFYADREGFMFPIKSECGIDVPVIEGRLPVRQIRRGEIQDEKDRLWVSRLLDMMDMINGNKEFRGRLESVSVRGNGDIVLRLAGSGVHFIIGQPDRIEEKLAGASRYFSHIEPAMGKDYYKSVILKYKKQIVCRRDIL